VKDKIKVEEQEIKAYYKSNSKDYLLPERVQALQIVVNNELEAEAIYNNLQEGADFFQLAKSKSVSPEGVHGGDLGFFSRGQMPKEFDDAVFNLKVGQFSKVVQTPYGYHIFKVIKKKRDKTMSFKEAREKIKEKLIKEKEKKEYLDWISNLREKSVIVIKENVLADI
jgi:parvulin-like peptidyl-prolyl isomerase